ncbi:MAG: hypothetical protein A2231_08515 [Candidatus Firestonebacteria bacterium RIFOXYA2_FULL_40_8]|nr:MAG: hypothetical protein A2231_08515 [Candidatus Firestonebacteria bacterium RIFOXYA2_FULL_40_8]
MFAILLFIITSIKVFLVDLSFLDTGYRIVSFIGLGVILIVTAYLYSRYKDKILEFTKGDK